VPLVPPEAPDAPDDPPPFEVLGVQPAAPESATQAERTTGRATLEREKLDMRRGKANPVLDRQGPDIAGLRGESGRLRNDCPIGCAAAARRQLSLLAADESAMNLNLSSLLVVSSVLASAACSAGGESAGGGTMDSPGANGSTDMGLVTHCAGDYLCTYDGTVTPTTLAREGGQCMAGKVALSPGGVATTPDGGKLDWRGDRNAFSICEGSACMSCKNTAPVTATPSGSGSSGGSAAPSGTCTGHLSCNSSPPCGPVGCYMHTHYHYDGKGNVSYTDYSCDGSPSSDCEDNHYESTCKATPGCTWK